MCIALHCGLLEHTAYTHGKDSEILMLVIREGEGLQPLPIKLGGGLIFHDQHADLCHFRDLKRTGSALQPTSRRGRYRTTSLELYPL